MDRARRRLMAVLFLAHRVPFPPDRGDKIRSYHALRHLASRMPVHLVAFAEDPADRDPPAAFLEGLASCTIVPRTKSRIRAGVEALATGRAISLAAFDDAAMHRAVRDTIAAHGITTVYAFSAQMAQYVPPGVRFVMDFVDVDSAKFAQYAEEARGPMRWLMQREARLYAAWERDAAARADASLFVSEAEAALFGGGARVHAVANGIDARTFDPAAGFAAVDAPTPLIVFTGQMDYPPNVAAVTWFVREVLPHVPDATFAIVGRAPVREVRALAGGRVIVTGAVDDVRGWLVAADLCVAPLMLARGVQNKVLEAMAMARPVIASAAAAEGIDHGGTLIVAEGAAGFAEAIAGVLADPAAASRQGAAARARVLERYDWDARLAPLVGLVTA